MSWSGIFVGGSFESKIQKKLRADKELLDRIVLYKKKSSTFFSAFVEVFSKSDKKTYKDNLAHFFATADQCLDFVAEPYTKYEERLPDKWNEIFKAIVDHGSLHVLTVKEEAKVLPQNQILVEQMRSKPGGQLIEIEVPVADKLIQMVICELANEQWTIIRVEDRV